MHRISLLSLIFTIILSACSHKGEITDALLRADAVLCEHPDSALAILHATDTTGISDSQRAHFALLNAKASDKSYIELTDVSSIARAADYYHDHGDSLEVQSAYYLGIVQHNADEYGRALISLMQAHEIAENVGELFYKAMSSRALADVYSDLLAYDAAVRHDSICINEFMEAGKPYYAMVEKFYFPYCLIKNNDYKKALEVLDENAKDVFFFETPERKYWYYSTNAQATFELGNYIKAEELYDSCIHSYYNETRSQDFSYAALNYLKLGKQHKAQDAIRHAKIKAKQYSDTLYYMLAETRLAEFNNDYKCAFYLHDSIYSKYNRKRNQLLSHPYTTVLTDYFSNKSAERLDILNTKQKQLWMLVAITLLSLLSVVLLYIIYKRKIRIRDLENENLLNDINQLGLRIRRMSEAIAIKENMNRDHRLFTSNSLVTIIDHILAIQNHTPVSIDGNSHLRKAINATLDELKSDLVLEEIQSFADLSKGNIITKMKNQIPALTLKHLNYVSLLVIGFSNPSICRILGINTINALHQMRSRIKIAIEKSMAKDSNLFLAVLKSKKNKF